MTNYQHEQYFAHCHGHPKKPLEIYMFVDPLCPECWSLEPVMKKLKIRYGRFFTLRIIASASLTALNKKRKKTSSCRGMGKDRKPLRHVV